MRLSVLPVVWCVSLESAAPQVGAEPLTVAA
jgi:hypothetical protein